MSFHFWPTRCVACFTVISLSLAIFASPAFGQSWWPLGEQEIDTIRIRAVHKVAPNSLRSVVTDAIRSPRIADRSLLRIAEFAGFSSQTLTAMNALDAGDPSAPSVLIEGVSTSEEADVLDWLDLQFSDDAHWLLRANRRAGNRLSVEEVRGLHDTLDIETASSLEFDPESGTHRLVVDKAWGLPAPQMAHEFMRQFVESMELNEVRSELEADCPFLVDDIEFEAYRQELIRALANCEPFIHVMNEFSHVAPKPNQASGRAHLLASTSSKFSSLSSLASAASKSTRAKSQPSSKPSGVPGRIAKQETYPKMSDGVRVNSNRADTASKQTQPIQAASQSVPTQPVLTSTSSGREVPGISISFTAEVVGTTSGIEFSYRMRSSRSEWRVVRDYATNGSWTWNTSGLPADIYYVTAFVRRIGSTANYEATAIPLTITLTSVAPATGVTLVYDGGATTVLGETVRFTATGRGGSGQYEFQYRLRSSRLAWHVVREYSSDASWMWNTTLYSPDEFYVEVKVRAATSPASWEAYAISPVLSLVAQQRATGVDLVSDQPNRIAPGTTIRFSATARGQAPAYEYQYRMRSSQSEWQVVRDYSNMETWTWNTTGLPTDIYYVTAFVRQVGSRAAYEAAATPPTITLTSVTPATGVAFVGDLSSAIRSGDLVPIQAQGLGGTGSYEYRIRIKLKGRWTIVKEFGATPVWNWNTTGLLAGVYDIELGVRSMGSPSGPEAYRIFTITLYENTEQLWDRVLTPYLRDDLWSDQYIEDATHTLQVPLERAFAVQDDRWRNEFADHFRRFMAAKPSINVELYRLEYYYLASRFVALCAQNGRRDLIPDGMVKLLYDEVEKLWLLQPAWMWDSPPFQGGMRERVIWKRDVTTTKYKYYRGITEHDIFVITIAAELKKYERLTGTVEARTAVLNDVLQIARTMFEQFVVSKPDGGWLFQPGVWSDHPEYQYAGNPELAPNLQKMPIDDIAEDSSHAIRWPLWLKSLMEAYPVGSPDRGYYQNLMNGLEIQFMEHVIVAPTADFNAYRTTNFMDGRNGVYRYSYYTAGSGKGYGPYGVSATIYYGWWTFLNSDRTRAVYDYMQSRFPLTDAIVTAYVGPNTSRVRHPLEMLPAAFQNGIKELLTLLSAENRWTPSE